jgi:hypothetical protein
MGRARKFDVGLDLKLFNNKVSIVTDYFIDTRKDFILFLFQELQSKLLHSAIIEVGSIRAISLDYKNKIFENFNMSVGYNVTSCKMKFWK